jgi:hypothetical protein
MIERGQSGFDEPAGDGRSFGGPIVLVCRGDLVHSGAARGEPTWVSDAGAANHRLSPRWWTRR